MFNKFRVTATFERINFLSNELETVEGSFSHSFDHLSEALIWKTGLAATCPEYRILITDPDGYAVAEATQAAFRLNF